MKKIAVTLLLLTLPLVGCDDKPKADAATAGAIAGEFDQIIKGAVAIYGSDLTLSGSAAQGAVEDDRYLITIPVTTLAYRNPFERTQDLVRVEFPALTLTMKEAGDGVYDFTSPGLAQIRLLSGEGQLWGTLTATQSSVSGRWRRGEKPYGRWPNLKIALGEITGRDAAAQPLFTLGKVTLESQSTVSQDQQKFDSVVDFTAGGLKVDQPEFGLTVGKMDIRYDIKHASLPALQAMYESLAEFSRAMDKYSETAMAAVEEIETGSAAGTDPEGATPPQPSNALQTEHAKALIESLFRLGDSIVETGMDSGYVASLHDIEVRAGGEDPMRFQLAKAQLDYRLEQAERLGLFSRLGYEGLRLPADGAFYNDFIPTEAVIDYGIEQVPLRELMAFGRTVYAEQFDEILAGERISQNTAMAYLGQLKNILAKAGTALRIREARTVAPSLSAKIEGALTADAAAIYGFSGKLEGRLTGLDAAIARLQQKAAAGEMDVRHDPGLLPGLTMMQAMGRTDGEARVYVFELKPDGALLMNGTDYGVFLSSLRASSSDPEEEIDQGGLMEPDGDGLNGGIAPDAPGDDESRMTEPPGAETSPALE